MDKPNFKEEADKILAKVQQHTFSGETLHLLVETALLAGYDKGIDWGRFQVERLLSGMYKNPDLEDESNPSGTSFANYGDNAGTIINEKLNKN